jgi:hypothetical protein
MNVTIYPYVIARLRMSRAIPLLYVPSGRAQRRLLYAELYADYTGQQNLTFFLSHKLSVDELSSAFYA